MAESGEHHHNPQIPPADLSPKGIDFTDYDPDEDRHLLLLETLGQEDQRPRARKIKPKSASDPLPGDEGQPSRGMVDAATAEGVYRGSFDPDSGAYPAPDYFF